MTSLPFELTGLLLAKTDRLPNPEAVALSPLLGWLTFACVMFAMGVVYFDRERFRRFWLRTEDPRAIGLFRIALMSTLLLNINNMWPHFEFLFTDEGLYMTDSARQFQAGSQFKGYGEGINGEPVGFFDFDAFLLWLKGPRYSLLYFWSSPDFFWWYIAAFEVFTIAFLLGFKSRFTGVVSLILTLGLMNRSPIYQSGADVVFRVMFVYLVFARAGHAYSVDNWLRRRRLRKQGRLDDRDGPGKGAGAFVDDPEAGKARYLEPIFRRIPAWPRTFMILQLATIYLWTGCAKTGHVWWRGDSLYYALNLDHFSRVPTAYFGYIFGTNLFRLMTWTVHFWQIGFSLMVLGLIVRWARREQLAPPAGPEGLGLRLSWLGLALGALSIILVGLPVHYPEKPIFSVEYAQLLTALGGFALIAVVAWGWKRLRDRPFNFSIRGVPVSMDLDLFCSVFLGRRLWLTLGLIFHLHILVLMNIGMFAPVMVISYIACLNGTEVATLLRRSAKLLTKLEVPFIPEWVARGEAITPTEALDPRSPRVHGGNPSLPAPALLTTLVWIIAAVLLRVEDVKWWWVVATIALSIPFGVTVFTDRFGRRKEAAPVDPRSTHLAYGRKAGTLAMTLLAMHIMAVAGWSIPQKGCTSTWRNQTRNAVKPWLKATQTLQSWNMFAPNPTRANVFMKVYLVDAEGERWDMYTDANSPRNKVTPWFVYDRMGKITRRTLGDGPGYQKWVARYHCRTWALEHGGELPQSVEIVKQWYRIPSPEKMRKHGPYEPSNYLEEHGKSKTVKKVRCVREPDAQPTNELRRRHGLPEVDDKTIKRAVRPRYDRWMKQQARKAEKAAKKN